ncbi:unnamed protein product [Cuscuta campestris]|uniref:Uncharacterized protein n=1 Tax=Cuscuta campestris TaxID=132261 RepID=A0A484KH36_9ASTE|nr:unnamed protein product [Cuscuta campestris]
MITDPKTIAKYKSPAAVKDEMDAWNGFDFLDFNTEQIASNEKGTRQMNKGKAKVVEGSLKDEEFGKLLMDQSSTTKPRKKPRNGIVIEDLIS